jgi:acyl carrier protein
MITSTKEMGSVSVEEQVLEVVRDLLTELGSHRAAQSVTPHLSFERDLGLGSLERVELLVRCEARFHTRLPDEIAQQADTPSEWAQALVDDTRDQSAGAVEKRYHIQQPVREAPPAPESATNWVDVLRRHADLEPDRVHIHLLEDGAGRQDISYGQLLRRASEVAAGLRALRIGPDETVAIMLPTCADFFYSFLGVMLAGGIAVPIYPPARPDKIEEYVRRQVLILRNAGVRFLISFERVKAVSQILRLGIPSLIDVTSVEALRQIGLQAGTKVTTAAVEPSATAFIQYTSGSTGDPKGVVLSQENVLANVRGIGRAVSFRPDDIVVSWLPLYHDMGLIGSWLFSVYFGAPITILSPLAFLVRPERWLWALHDSEGTLCPAPNFAYELCARKIPDTAIAGLDLRAWRVAINAGEAVLPDTLARFAKRFEPCGFRPESYVPCYGLAESSVALTFPPINRLPVIDTIRRDLFEAEGKAMPARRPDEPDSEVLRFVANGVPLPGHQVRIVDDAGRETSERVQGRVLFRGPSTTSGYYRNPEATKAVIDEDGWLDSGDLGYWANGELFITGRLKDCIIKSGRNIIPPEVEAAAAEVQGVRKGCVAAFGIADAETGTERLVVAAETRATDGAERPRIEAEIIKSVDAILGIPPDTVVLVSPQSIPKTSSGKIRRNETRNLYLSGRLDRGVLPPWLQVVRLWKEHLGTWAGLRVSAARASARRAYASGVVLSTTTLAGTLVHFAPSQRAAARVVQSAARLLLQLTGERVTVKGADRVAWTRPAVLFANRAGHLDPLVLAATLPSPFLIADSATLASLPTRMSSLLGPLVVPPLNGDAAPPGGTLRERIRRALEDGHSVLVLPDGSSGAPPSLSRFRLDALHAALETGSPIRAIGVLGTSGILPACGGLRNWKLETRNSKIGKATAEVRLGEPLSAPAPEALHRPSSGASAPDSGAKGVHVRSYSHAILREDVRRAIAELCR